MENIIIVFTNHSSLNNVSKTLRDKRGIPLIKHNNFIGFNESSGEFEVVRAISDKYRIYFVKDTISQNEFNDFISFTNKKYIHILRHRLPNLNFDDFPVSNRLKGAHDSTGPFYDHVLRIITDTGPDKFKRLFDSLFTYDHVLEAKLVLLDDVLSGSKSLTKMISIITDDKADKVKRLYEPLLTTNPDLGKRILESTETRNGIKVSLEEKLTLLKNEFKSLKAVDETDIFSTEYQMAFDKLRDALGVK
jgi:hypothetical protein